MTTFTRIRRVVKPSNPPRPAGHVFGAGLVEPEVPQQATREAFEAFCAENRRRNERPRPSDQAWLLGHELGEAGIEAAPSAAYTEAERVAFLDGWERGDARYQARVEAAAMRAEWAMEEAYAGREACWA